jgi:hypothetical protein
MTRRLDQSAAERAWSLLDQLQRIAAGNPDGIALRHKDRGRWLVWRWRIVVAEVDRIAAGLRALGLAAGSTLAVSGDIGPHLILVALGARLIGARVLSVSREAERSALREMLGSETIVVVVTQGRGGLASWIKAAADTGTRVRIVFDHVTADGHAPHPDVITFARLRSLAEPAGWTELLPRSAPRRQAGDHIWIEETTRWADGLETVVAAWLAAGATLVFPEILASATRDRRQIQPSRWIASAERLAVASRDIEARLPKGRSLTARLIARIVAAGAEGAAARLVAGLLRRRLGLSRLTGIELIDDRGDAGLDGDIRRLWRGLGVRLHAPSAPRAAALAARSAVALEAAGGAA